MKYSLILITHRDTDKATSAIQSVLMQTHRDWELLVVHDSPENKNVGTYITTLQDPRIRHLENNTSQGLNVSRNKGLDNTSINSDWVLFLDDTSTLAPDTLHTFTSLIEKHNGVTWFMTNKAHKDGASFTKAPQEDRVYSYTWDYLIQRKIQGPGLWCIETHLLGNQRFPTGLRDAADWLFFFQIATRSKFFYHDHNSAIYTASPKPEKSLKQYLKPLLHEAHKQRILYDPRFIITVFMLYFFFFTTDRTT